MSDSSSSLITGLGIALLVIYGFTKILEFYGVGINVYGSYIAFYLFLLISIYILPTKYNTFTV
jgi:hypothetical protein